MDTLRRRDRVACNRRLSFRGRVVASIQSQVSMSDVALWASDRCELTCSCEPLDERYQGYRPELGVLSDVAATQKNHEDSAQVPRIY